MMMMMAMGKCGGEKKGGSAMKARDENFHSKI